MTDIVIDAGHGGTENVGGSSWNNAVGPRGTLEKTLTLEVATRMAQQLANVTLTRSEDVNLGLAARADVARAARARFFVSIHFNASLDGQAQGTETLVHTNYSTASAQLSLLVQDSLLKVTQLRDRNRAFDPSGIKPMPLGVLNPQYHDPDTAACLVEVSFLDRADEEQRLQDPIYLDRIAEAIGDGVNAMAEGAAPPLVQEPLWAEHRLLGHTSRRSKTNMRNKVKRG
ncbi:N-acetylmuramoyl-L-alanine amidase [Tateyamaria omphalii]|uniref:N-acetylmuramoyl-L-alanine amidase n=1 Tax=Tateyamaria omphalii TaxID=299262 RepID=UPI001C993E72|nr:N-acetylmuramoyl-L-alanine amidase [Tateyamaria omphalii]MBY5933534.1 N-acetylmuramoyl-L-alanine amidase [Tateyamaria omphalii]